MAKIVRLTNGDLGSVIDETEIRAFRTRALMPDRPTIRGTAQNPDVYFQGSQCLLLERSFHRSGHDGATRATNAKDVRTGMGSKEFTPAMVRGISAGLREAGTQKAFHRWYH